MKMCETSQKWIRLKFKYAFLGLQIRNRGTRFEYPTWLRACVGALA